MPVFVLDKNKPCEPQEILILKRPVQFLKTFTQNSEPLVMHTRLSIERALQPPESRDLPVVNL